MNEQETLQTRLQVGDHVRVLTGMFQGHEGSIEQIISSEQPDWERYDISGTWHRWYFADEIEVIAA